ncbi:hypothetical protein C8R44DRAFT_741469 [Mycena epipterygia]|nr:hypothetical protein C8R44DRAFT_741469 [Mycena epipterygia]
MIHAAAYTGEKAFAGKCTLVVGAGNSATDICQDLAFQGAAVTMLQRSSTCVVSLESGVRMLARMWPSEVRTEVADFKVEAMPFLLVHEIGKVMTEMMWAEKETYTGLREAGLSLTMRKDGSGQYPMLFERFEGYCITSSPFAAGVDVGTAKLIRQGKVGVKQGVEIARFTEHSAVFRTARLSRSTPWYTRGFHSRFNIIVTTRHH